MERSERNHVTIVLIINDFSSDEYCTDFQRRIFLIAIKAHHAVEEVVSETSSCCWEA